MEPGRIHTHGRLSRLYAVIAIIKIFFDKFCLFNSHVIIYFYIFQPQTDIVLSSICERLNQDKICLF